MAKRKSRAKRKSAKKYWAKSNQGAIPLSQEGQQVDDISSMKDAPPVRALHTEQEAVSTATSAVTGDLKRIGILSGLIFVVLIVLSFVLS